MDTTTIVRRSKSDVKCALLYMEHDIHTNQLAQPVCSLSRSKELRFENGGSIDCGFRW